MISFLDEVRHDLDLAQAEKRHLQNSIQSLSSQVNALMNEIDSNERELSCIINLFKQRQSKFKQNIEYFRHQKREQNKELLRAEQKISCLNELETLRGPLDFCRFPEEIRNMILEWALFEDSPIDFELHPPTGHRPRRLAIFQTSKQIYAEAFATFHRQNKFAMDGTNIERFLVPERINYVRHLSLHLGSETSTTKVLRAIEKCQDLRSLHIRLVALPRFQRRVKCNEEHMRKLVFKRPDALEQISTDFYGTHLETILEPLRCILQIILEKGRFEQPEQPLRKSARIGSSSTGESNRSTGESMAKS